MSVYTIYTCVCMYILVCAHTGAFFPSSFSRSRCPRSIKRAYSVFRAFRFPLSLSLSLRAFYLSLLLSHIPQVPSDMLRVLRTHSPAPPVRPANPAASYFLSPSLAVVRARISAISVDRQYTRAYPSLSSSREQTRIYRARVRAHDVTGTGRTVDEREAKGEKERKKKERKRDREKSEREREGKDAGGRASTRLAHHGLFLYSIDFSKSS